MIHLQWLYDTLLEVVAPEHCVVCERSRTEVAWTGRTPGARAVGLAGWHQPHLCAECFASWCRAPRRGMLDGRPVWAALPEHGRLVRAVGAWKYQGLRGLSHPFAALLAPVLNRAQAAGGPARLVAIPLHKRRLRERGFDQTRQLVELASRQCGISPATDVLTRPRPSPQQASQPVTGDSRRANVARAFAARAPAPGEDRAVALVDDLATTGATLLAAAAALAAAGWRVVWFAALGLAPRLDARRTLDTSGPSSLASASQDDTSFESDAGARARGEPEE